MVEHQGDAHALTCRSSLPQEIGVKPSVRMRTATSRAEHLTVFGTQVGDITDQLARRRATKLARRSAQAPVVG